MTAISSSPLKEKVSTKIGAGAFINAADFGSMKKSVNALDLVLNTIPAQHQVSKYFSLLRKSGTIVQLGYVLETHQVSQANL